MPIVHHRKWLGWAAVGVAVMAVAAGLALWARHGAAVFFDMVAAGIAYCF